MAIEIEIDGIFADGITDSITYNPSGGDSVSIDAIIDRESYQIDYDDSGKVLHKTVNLLVKTADVNSDVSDDTFTFDSLDWPVVEFRKISEAFEVTVQWKELKRRDV